MGPRGPVSPDRAGDPGRSRSRTGPRAPLGHALGDLRLSRIRVLRVIARLNLGGPAHQAAYLSGRRMDPDRFETLLVHGRLAPGEESMAYLAEREGAATQHLQALRPEVRPLDDGRAVAALRGVIREFEPDIVHTHTAKAGFAGRAAALTGGRGSRPALVHTFHGHVLEGYFGAVKTRAYRAVERALARRTDRLIGVSDATVADLVRLGVAPRERFQVIPLGIDLAPLAGLEPGSGRALRDELGLDGDAVLAAFVGRIAPVKRLDVLLRALARARERAARIHLAIVGDGPARGELETLASELGVRGATHFAGYRRDLAPLLAAADLAVLSSDNEGTPVSLIEAGAAGLPAVATAVGGVSEVVTPETGILVPRGDHAALGDALADLASDRPRREAMGEAARHRVLDRYSVDRLVAEIGSLYESLGRR